MAETASITLLSDIREMDRVAEFVKLLAERTGCNTDQEHRILLVLSEVVTNAIIHGNKKVRSKPVEVTALVTNSELLLTVSDQGEGFDPGAIPDPRKKENLLKTRGRGVWLIHKYADKVTYSDNGSKVSILIRLP